MENTTESQDNSTSATLDFNDIQTLFGSGEYDEDLGASILSQVAQELELIHDAAGQDGRASIERIAWRMAERCDALAGIVYRVNKELRAKAAGASFRALLESVSPAGNLEESNDLIRAMIVLAKAAGLETTFIEKVSWSMVSQPFCLDEWKIAHGIALSPDRRSTLERSDKSDESDEDTTETEASNDDEVQS
jgi:hypothetical protein